MAGTRIAKAPVGSQGGGLRLPPTHPRGPGHVSAPPNCPGRAQQAKHSTCCHNAQQPNGPLLLLLLPPPSVDQGLAGFPLRVALEACRGPGAVQTQRATVAAQPPQPPAEPTALESPNKTSWGWFASWLFLPGQRLDLPELSGLLGKRGNGEAGGGGASPRWPSQGEAWASLPPPPAQLDPQEGPARKT